MMQAGWPWFDSAVEVAGAVGDRGYPVAISAHCLSGLTDASLLAPRNRHHLQLIWCENARRGEDVRGYGRRFICRWTLPAQLQGKMREPAWAQLQGACDAPRRRAG